MVQADCSGSESDGPAQGTVPLEEEGMGMVTGDEDRRRDSPSDNRLGRAVGCSGRTTYSGSVWDDRNIEYWTRRSTLCLSSICSREKWSHAESLQLTGDTGQEEPQCPYQADTSQDMSTNTTNQATEYIFSSFSNIISFWGNLFRILMTHVKNWPKLPNRCH